MEGSRLLTSNAMDGDRLKKTNYFLDAVIGNLKSRYAMLDSVGLVGDQTSRYPNNVNYSMGSMRSQLPEAQPQPQSAAVNDMSHLSGSYAAVARPASVPTPSVAIANPASVIASVEPNLDYEAMAKMSVQRQEDEIKSALQHAQLVQEQEAHAGAGGVYGYHPYYSTGATPANTKADVGAAEQRREGVRSTETGQQQATAYDLIYAPQLPTSIVSRKELVDDTMRQFGYTVNDIGGMAGRGSKKDNGVEQPQQQAVPNPTDSSAIRNAMLSPIHSAAAPMPGANGHQVINTSAASVEELLRKSAVTGGAQSTAQPYYTPLHVDLSVHPPGVGVSPRRERAAQTDPAAAHHNKQNQMDVSIAPVVSTQPPKPTEYPPSPPLIPRHTNAAPAGAKAFAARRKQSSTAPRRKAAGHIPGKHDEGLTVEQLVARRGDAVAPFDKVQLLTTAERAYSGIVGDKSITSRTAMAVPHLNRHGRSPDDIMRTISRLVAEDNVAEEDRDEYADAPADKEAGTVGSGDHFIALLEQQHRTNRLITRNRARLPESMRGQSNTYATPNSAGSSARRRKTKGSSSVGDDRLKEIEKKLKAMRS